MLVTDGEQRAALAVTRSLGAAGYAVHVCSRSGHSLGGASRFARGDHTVPDALTAPDRFTGGLEAVVARINADILLPITEAALVAVLPRRARFPGLLIPFPEADIFRAVSDKERLVVEGRAVGLAIPEGTTLRAAEDLSDQLVRTLRYPVVVKPARSVSGGTLSGRPGAMHSVQHATDAEALRNVIGSLEPTAFPALVQTRILGPGVGIFLLVWNGRTIATFAHRRLREKPPSGGVSVYSESVVADPALVRSSEALLARFGWSGVAMVEYKVDARTGRPYLMEVNGRFWGSLQLAIDAGVDFPKMLVDAAAGRIPAPVTAYQAGARNRWWWGDVDVLLTRMRRSAARLALPPGTPGRSAVLRDFVAATLSPGRNEILRRDDPWPFFRETWDWLRGR
ncbi:MAG: hypothetical protein NVS4B3_04950 [Gemmatimonadaceae bacterium]